jgi:hypothetical protein
MAARVLWEGWADWRQDKTGGGGLRFAVCGLGEALMTLNEPVKANQLDKQVKSV